MKQTKIERLLKRQILTPCLKSKVSTEVNESKYFLLISAHEVYNEFLT